jgi:hypothetical protein
MGLSMTVYPILHNILTRMTLEHIAAMVTLDLIATVTLDTIVAFDTTFRFVIPLVSMLMSLPVMWHEEHL